MEAATLARGLSGAEKALLAFVVFQLGWATAGLIANPDFATGDSASAERILGVDFNGWHAVSGYLVFSPILLTLFWRRDLLVLVTLAATFGVFAAGIWAFFDTNPAEVFAFPNNEADGVFHMATTVVLLGLVWAIRSNPQSQ